MHEKGCFISREELHKLHQKFGSKIDSISQLNSQIMTSDKLDDIHISENAFIFYEDLSKEMGLHAYYLDNIQKQTRTKMDTIRDYSPETERDAK